MSQFVGSVGHHPIVTSPGKPAYNKVTRHRISESKRPPLKRTTLIKASPPRAARTLTAGPSLFALALALCFTLPLRAQQPAIRTNAPLSALDTSRLAGGGPVAARALANQVTTPTAVLTLVQMRDVLTPSVPGFASPANLFQLEPVFPIFPSRFLPFEQVTRLTLSFPTTPNPGSQTGFGDVALFDVVAFKPSWGRWGLGPALVFPTATTTPLGQGKWQAGPAVALIYTGVKHLTIGALAENLFSFAGPSSRPTVNALAVTPVLTYNLPHGWFVGSSDFDLTVDWRHSGFTTVPLGLQAGRLFKVGKLPVSLSLEGAWNVIHPSEAPNWRVGLELTVIFPTQRTPR